MTFALTAAQQAARDGFRDFVARSILPHAMRFDLEERLPESLLREMAERGYFGLTIPRAYGGADADMTTCGLLHEEIGRGCSSVRSLLTVHGMTAAAILRWGTAEQRARWLPPLASGEIIAAFALTEPVAGSDTQAVTTNATPSDGGFDIEGSKQWITSGQIAGMYLVIGRCNGQPSAFIVPRDAPSLSVSPVRGVLGLRATMLAELALNGCQVPAGALLGRIGFGVSHVAFTALDYARFTVAWGCVGLGQACLDASIRHATDRRQFGAPLKDHQLVRRKITDMVANVRAARLLCAHAAALRDAGDPDMIIETLVAKYFAARAARRAADDCVRIHGARGLAGDSPAQRYLRDAHVMEMIDGTPQIQQLNIAAYMFQDA